MSYRSWRFTSQGDGAGYPWQVLDLCKLIGGCCWRVEEFVCGVPAFPFSLPSHVCGDPSSFPQRGSCWPLTPPGWLVTPLPIVSGRSPKTPLSQWSLLHSWLLIDGHKCLITLSLSLSHSLSLSLSFALALSLSLCLLLCLCPSLALALSVSFSVSVPFALALALCLLLCRSVSLSLSHSFFSIFLNIWKDFLFYLDINLESSLLCMRFSLIESPGTIVVKRY